MGLFKFKGTPEALLMAAVCTARLGARSYPETAPSGKGNRVTPAHGYGAVATSAPVSLPLLPPAAQAARELWIKRRQQLKEQLRRHFNSKSSQHWQVTGSERGPGSTRSNSLMGSKDGSRLRALSLAGSFLSKLSSTREASLAPYQQQQRMTDLQMSGIPSPGSSHGNAAFEAAAAAAHASMEAAALSCRAGGIEHRCLVGTA
eukprot:gene8469-8652_t